MTGVSDALVIHAAGVLAAPADPAALASFVDHAAETGHPLGDGLVDWYRRFEVEAPAADASRKWARDLTAAACCFVLGRVADAGSGQEYFAVDARLRTSRALLGTAAAESTVWVEPAAKFSWHTVVSYVHAYPSGRWWQLDPRPLVPGRRAYAKGKRACRETDPAAVARSLVTAGETADPWARLVRSAIATVHLGRSLGRWSAAAAAREVPDAVAPHARPAAPAAA